MDRVYFERRASFCVDLAEAAKATTVRRTLAETARGWLVLGKQAAELPLEDQAHLRTWCERLERFRTALTAKSELANWARRS